jgi:hypothetical protein
MNKHRATPPALPLALVAAVLGAAAVEAAPPSAELARCAAIGAANERLACYDALECVSITAADRRLACYDALAKATTARPEAPPAPALQPSRSSGGDDPGRFGLPAHKARVNGGEDSQKIVARVTTVREDRQGNVTVILDNGQTWAIHERDRDPLLQSGDAVTIRRAALGSFLMTTPDRHSYRVQRLQ